MVVIRRMAILNTPEFWLNIRASTNKSSIGVFSDNGLIYVAMQDTIKMVPFLRKKEELFERTIKTQYARNKFRIIINGQFYGVNNAGLADALFGHDPVDPKNTMPEGIVVNNGSAIGGRSAPQMFYVANQTKAPRHYIFGYGNTPAGVHQVLVDADRRKQTSNY